MRNAIRSTRHSLRRAARLGFTLLEITVAMMIFFLIISFALWAMADSTDQGLAAKHSRELRMLAEMKLGEVAIFETYYNDEDGTDKTFDDLPEGMRDIYRDWHWSLGIKDVTVFGVKNDDNAPYLFGEPDEAKTTNADGTSGTGDSGGTPAAGATKKREPKLLRQIVVTVSVPSEDGEGDSDGIELVTYLPLPPQKTAAAPKGN